MTSMMNHMKIYLTEVTIFRYIKNTCDIEVYKFLAKLNLGFMWNFFAKNHTPYNLRRADLLLLPPYKSIRYGVNSLAFWGSLLWNNLPPQVKVSQTLEELKNRIRNLRSFHCTCTVCRWRIMPFYFNLWILLVFIMCFCDCDCFYVSDINLLRTSIKVI